MKRAVTAIVLGAMITTGALAGSTAASASTSASATPSESADDILPTLADTLAAASEAGATDLASAVGLPGDGPGSLLIDESGNVTATVRFASRPTEADLAAVRALATIVTVFTVAPAVSVSSPAEHLDDLAALPGVASVTPVIAPLIGSVSASPELEQLRAADTTTCRAFPSDAAAPLSVDTARADFGVDGTGVTVGIMSDSFSSGHASGPDAAADVAAGLLPGPGNPCGYETPVTVLGDITDQGADEGRAMAQLVHAVAPGAELMFHTAWLGSEAMAEGIIALADAGADVIVDDVSYLESTHFQQGVISAAINEVRSRGVAYYTSAGNSNVVGTEGTSYLRAIGSWETTAFRSMPCPSWVVVPSSAVTWDCLDFSPNGAGDATDTLFFDDPASPMPTVSWAEPQFGMTSAMIPQLYVDNGDGPELVSNPTFAAADSPVVASGLNADTPTVEGEVNLVILRGTLPGAAPTGPAVWTAFWGDSHQLASREYDTSAGDDRVGLISNGHSTDGSAIGVAAVDWQRPDVPEAFTSPGGGSLYFEPVAFGPDAEATPSPAYDEPRTAPGPQIASVDGNRTSFFGSPRDIDGETQYFFHGTSAAAPNAAAVHALALEYSPDSSEAVIAQAGFDTATAIRNPLSASISNDEFFGSGLINARGLLSQLAPRAVTGLAASPLSDTSIAVEWDARTGATGYRIELIAAGTVVRSVDTDADTTATTFTDLQPETTYTVSLTPLGAVAPGTAVTTEVSTPRTPQPAAPGTAPSVNDLTPGGAAALVATPSAVAAGASVTVTGLPPRAWVSAWLFSTPTSLGWVWTGTDGSATVTLPAAVTAGEHRLAFSTADGTTLGWTPLTVTAPAITPVVVQPGAAAAVLADTGLGNEPQIGTALAVALLLAGAGLTGAAVWRRSRTAR